MIGDLICWFLLTPLALSSGYLCVHGAVYYSHRSGTQFEVPGLVILAVFLAITYTIWITVSLRYHYTTWQEWRRSHQDVRLLETPVAIRTASSKRSTTTSNHQPETHDDRNNNDSLQLAPSPPRISTDTVVTADVAPVLPSRAQDGSHLACRPIFSSTPAVLRSATTTNVVQFHYSNEIPTTPVDQPETII